MYRFCWPNINLSNNQDDSELNRKVLRRQIESDSTGIWQNAVVKEADDGLTAVEAMRTEMAAEECFDFVLLDFVMVQPVCMYYINL